MRCDTIKALRRGVVLVECNESRYSQTGGNRAAEVGVQDEMRRNDGSSTVGIACHALSSNLRLTVAWLLRKARSPSKHVKAWRCFVLDRRRTSDDDQGLSSTQPKAQILVVISPVRSMLMSKETATNKPIGRTCTVRPTTLICR